MGHAIAFDTLQYSKKLVTAGFTEPQAEIQAEALKEIIEHNLATKGDILELKRDILEVKKEMKQLEERLSYKLTIRFGGMIVTAVLVLAAIIKL